MARFSGIIMAKGGISYARNLSDERISDRIKTIKESGTQILKLDDTTRKAMLKECQKVRKEIRESVSSEIYDAYIR